MVNGQLEQGFPLTYRAWWELAGKLAQLLRTVHDRGVILRDFNPNNVLVVGDRLFLIDLELAQLDTAAPAVHQFGGTAGFSAPEQFRGELPAPSVDLYSLGAILMFLATASNPEILLDCDGGRTLAQLVARRLSQPRLPYALPASAIELIGKLLSEEPSSRPTLIQVSELLAAQRPDVESESVNLWRRPSATEACSKLRVLSDAQWNDLVEGIIAHLDATADFSVGSARVWPSTAYGNETEPCAVQYGAGGVLAVLARLYRHRRTIIAERLLTAVCDWIQSHVREVEHNLPGLYFGASGTALALYEAGVVLRRSDCVDLSVALLRGLPRRWPNPDVTHGAAGVGTALLSLWQATGASNLARLVAEAAEGIVAAWTRAARRLHGRCRSISTRVSRAIVPTDSRTALQALAVFSSAQGRLWDEDLVAIACRSGKALMRLAEHDDGVAVWNEGPGKPGPLTHWCNGSSGVGTFFVRLAAVGGDSAYLTLAESAARAVMSRRWYSGTAYCHGLAGDGDFLLDLAQVTSSAVHRSWAEEIAATLYDRRVYRSRCAVIPNETGTEITAEFGTGLAGHLAFLLRLRHGGPRMFHPPWIVHAGAASS